MRSKSALKLELYEWYDKENDLLECLLCGKKCKSLGQHILKFHKMDVYEYKNEFGIQKSQGLNAKCLLENISETALKNIKEGKWEEKKKGVIYCKTDGSSDNQNPIRRLLISKKASGKKKPEGFGEKISKIRKYEISIGKLRTSKNI